MENFDNQRVVFYVSAGVPAIEDVAALCQG